MLPTNYRSTAKRQIVCFFHAKNKPIPENFDCINTTFITLNRVKCVQYLGLMIDENLYWHMHVEHVYNSLMKYFGIFNHVKTIISKNIARQLYFAFIHSRIKYGIEVFEDCANEYLQKLQVIQNKLLTLLLNFDRRTSTNELHQQLSLLNVVDIRNVNLLSFVNECRSGRYPTLFSNYYHAREAGYDLRQKDRLHVHMARTDIDQSCCKIKVPGYGITNSTWLTNICIKKAFGRLSQNNSLKHINKFIISSNISVYMLCYCHNVIILMCSMLYHTTISKYETHWYWTIHIENIMYSTHLGTMKYSP